MLKNYLTDPRHVFILYMIFFVFFTLVLVSFSSPMAHSAQPASLTFPLESSVKILVQNPVQNSVHNSGQNFSQSSGLYYTQNSVSNAEYASSQTGLSSWPPRSDSQKQDKSSVQMIKKSASYDKSLPVQAEGNAQSSSTPKGQHGQLDSSSYANKESSADQSVQPLGKGANSRSDYDSEQKKSYSELEERSGRTLFKDSPQAGGNVPVITPSTAFKDTPGGSINGTMDIGTSEASISSWSANATRALLRYTDSSPAPGSESMPQLVPLGE